MKKNIELDIVKVADLAAIACQEWVGKGQEKLADQAAVSSMRQSLNELDIAGRIVIGEGERDEAPMLYIGEEVGTGNGDAIDIALDPLEGTTICATASPGSLAVIAFAQKGNFLHAPDVYMEKIAVNAPLPEGVLDLDNSVKTNLANLAKVKKCDISDLTTIILQRDRHQELIAKTREAGARVKLIGDGDIAAILATSDCPGSEGDIYMGTGGAPEGVLSAAAIRTTGGQMMGRLIFNDDQKQIERAQKMGVSDLNRKYSANDMAKGDVVFVASGVTKGDLLDGVIKHGDQALVNSLVMSSKDQTIRKILTSYKI